MKRLYLWTLLFLTALLLALSYFYFYFKKESENLSKRIDIVNIFNADEASFPSAGSTSFDAAPKGSPRAGAEPEIKRIRLLQVHQLPVVSFAFDFDDNFIIFTEKASGHSLGKKRAGSKSVRITQNSDRDNLYALYGETLILKAVLDENFLPNFFVEDPKGKARYELEEDFAKCIYAKEGDKFLCQKIVENGSEFVILDLKNDKEKTIFESPLLYWDFDFANSNALLWQSPSSKKESSLIWIKGGEIKKVFSGFGLEAKLLKGGEKALVSVFQNGESALFVLNLQDGVRTDLPFKTFASKCAEGEEKIYCAVPKEGVGDGRIEEWRKGKFFFKDEFWSFDKESGDFEKLKLSTLGTEFDIEDVKAYGDSHLLFKDKRKSALWLVLIPAKEGENKNANENENE